MLNIFRNIRRKLANENRFLQYTRYAIGEIVLVMIGILLALQVNNWNEERKQANMVVNSLESLIKDLTIQKELIEEQLKYEVIKIKQVDTVISNIRNPKARVVGRLLDSLTSRHTFVTMQSSYKNLEDSGGLIYIKDVALQNNIVRYFQVLDYTSAVTNNNNLHLIDNLYGKFASQNPFHLIIDQNDLVKLGRNLTDEERYTIQTNLIQRLQASESIESLIGKLGKETETLMAQIKHFLKT